MWILIREGFGPLSDFQPEKTDFYLLNGGMMVPLWGSNNLY